MSLLSYNQLVDLVEKGVIGPIEHDQINAASIDVRLGSDLVIEKLNLPGYAPAVDIKKREVFPSETVDMGITGYYDLKPGEFILAHTVEVFNLPMDICAEFKLKSSGARTGLENALATWCDNGWSGSVLTLELKNLLQYHPIRLTPGMLVGQMIFYRTEPVPVDRSYKVRGRYNNDTSAQTVKL